MTFLIILCFTLAAVVSSIALGLAPIAFVSTIVIGFPALAIGSVARRMFA